MKKRTFVDLMISGRKGLSLGGQGERVLGARRSLDGRRIPGRERELLMVL